MVQVDEWVKMAREARREGRLADAAELYEFVAGKCEEAEAPLKGAHARRHAAELLLEAQDVAAAQKAIGRVLELYREEGDIPPLEMANALRVKGLVDEAAGCCPGAVGVGGGGGDLSRREGGGRGGRGAAEVGGIVKNNG
jgi:hypothetical protein